MGSMTDKAKGLANEAAGNIKQGVGKVLDDKKMQAEGWAQERKGEAQQVIGEGKEKAKRAVDDL